MAESSITNFSTIATDPLRNFRFHAQFSSSDGTAFDSRITKVIGGFQSIGGLGVSVGSIPYREGGFNTTLHQMPGMATFAPITMTRGAVYGNPQGLTWMRGLFAATSGEGIDLGTNTGVNSKSFRCNIKIYVNEHPNTDASANTPRMGFIARNAWLSGLTYSDLNAQAGSLIVETMTFVHEGLSMFYTDTSGNPSDPTFKLSNA